MYAFLTLSERRDGAWTFLGPVEPGPRQELRAIVDARGNVKAVQFAFMQPLRPRRRLLDRLGKLRRNEARKGRVASALAAARQTGLDGLRGRTLTTRDIG
ncbi:MAG TPA: hypothetical protein VGL12_13065, partial [Roseiarcus sp.]